MCAIVQYARAVSEGRSLLPPLTDRQSNESSLVEKQKNSRELQKYDCVKMRKVQKVERWACEIAIP